jgi:hypothetical protein
VGHAQAAVVRLRWQSINALEVAVRHQERCAPRIFRPRGMSIRRWNTEMLT